jgi:hypothetical protein
MSSYQGLSTNNATAKNSRFQSKRDFKQIFTSLLLRNHQDINNIEKILSGSVHINCKANLLVEFIQKWLLNIF